MRRAEKTARILIAMGGVGTILAVALILVFLVWVVMPLFLPGDMETAGRFTGSGSTTDTLAFGVDEYQLVSWTLGRDGRLAVREMLSGTILEQRPLITGAQPSAWSVDPGSGRLMLGFLDGTVRFGGIGFDVTFVERSEAQPALRDLGPGEARPFGKAVAERTTQGQIRLVRLKVEVEDPIEALPGPIRLIDRSDASHGRVFAVLGDSNELVVFHEESVTDMMTGETRIEWERVDVAYDPPRGRAAPKFLRLSGIGKVVLLFWEDGYAIRFDARSGQNPRAAETFDVTEGDATVTAIQYMVGKTTLIVGDSSGRVQAWFPIKPDNAGTIDGIVMAKGHELPFGPAEVVGLAPSPLSRLLAVAYADGELRLIHVTNETIVARTKTDPVTAIALAPHDDGLAAIGPHGLWRWKLDPGHPEATLSALFSKVWYEGYTEPQHVWQSAGGSDDFEPKLGLVPLIFGTLKATLYSMLIALPIALLAAIYTSEFMSRKLRAPIKSVVEMMAGLPSVVLGFLAALVIAPFVQDVLPATLAAVLTIPLALMVGARLWQLLPTRLFLRWGGLPRFGMIVLALPLGILLAGWMGPFIEVQFFSGDMKAWLNGQVGDVGSGWTFLLLPFGALLTAFLIARLFGSGIRARSTDWSRARCATFDLGRLVVVIAGGYLVAVTGAWLLSKGGVDPRDAVLGEAGAGAVKLGIVGTYAQRNAMIVGFVMGFAIVPIIYTLAEDALSAVPSALREGSLGAGATPWQTTRRIVLPTAMSGVFGAAMVGLGRAVGETMIVLMAAGNTPILEWNPFNGFRTLSANIATELPEAVRGSTHYRTLFLAALVLFAITFVLNTIAEMVRRRFRQRYAEQL